MAIVFVYNGPADKLQMATLLGLHRITCDSVRTVPFLFVSPDCKTK